MYVIQMSATFRGRIGAPVEEDKRRAKSNDVSFASQPLLSCEGLARLLFPSSLYLLHPSVRNSELRCTLRLSPTHADL